MRGGQPKKTVLPLAKKEFSPHVRGSTRRTIGTVLVLVILPARAGINLVLVDFDDLDVYLPRMRGGQPDLIVDAYTTLEFPPAYAGM